MTPKEYAVDLTHKMFMCDLKTQETDMGMLWPHAKECAKIAVEAMLNDDWYIATREDNVTRKVFLNDVLNEINAMI